MSEEPDFSEDDAILSKLENEADREAFSNLMAHAHGLGVSAADFIREEPKRTSRKSIRKFCLENHKRTFKMMISSVIKSLWDRPANDATKHMVNTLYGPPMPNKTHSNGQARRASCE